MRWWRVILANTRQHWEKLKEIVGNRSCFQMDCQSQSPGGGRVIDTMNWVSLYSLPCGDDITFGHVFCSIFFGNLSRSLGV